MDANELLYMLERVRVASKDRGDMTTVDYRDTAICLRLEQDGLIDLVDCEGTATGWHRWRSR